MSDEWPGGAHHSALITHHSIIPLVTAAPQTTITLNDLLIYMAKQEASDLHLKPMRPPLVRIRGKLVAAMISHVSEHEPLHIVTIEDPIEFLFQDKMAAISQREVGTDTPNFKEALRNAMRQDPDVIMVGEMRDRETMETVLTAAETGHLVFSTLHTNNAAQTIDRIIDSFPVEQHKQIRAQLGLVLRGIVSLKLVKTTSGSLTAAVEVMTNSPQIAKMIEEGATKDILEAMESSVGLFRMQSMNQALIALLSDQKIT